MRHAIGVRPLLACLALILMAESKSWSAENDLVLAKRPEAQPRNIVLILADDHRYDAIGALGHPFLKTPGLDAMLRDGVVFRNAFVTTSLCSPSRASILTGQFMHRHGVIDNREGAPEGIRYFPQYLQAAGYATAFIGKWHMGGSTDAPQPGFDHWVSFKGQGRYLPRAEGKTLLNVNGEATAQKGYLTDELTDYALEWLGSLAPDKRFLLFLSHKAVHGRFEPAERHAKLYDDVHIRDPATAADTPENRIGKPRWVLNQRNSWHGVDFPYHSNVDLKEYYRQYCRTLASLDESVSRVRNWLAENGRSDDTLVLYLGDNGFLFGEHGLIDKRNAYEESIRIPLIAVSPGQIPAASEAHALVANIDIASTLLEAAGLEPPADVDGRSFLPIARGEAPPEDWRRSLLYEYYWEWNYPQTPSMTARRGERFKLIVYHGIWDTDELYDLEADSLERHNLIDEPEYRKLVARLRRELFEALREAGANRIPFGFKRGPGANLRRAGGSKTAPFPERILRRSNADD